MAKQTKSSKMYTERFKRHVVSEVLSGQLTRGGASRKYGIGGNTTVHKWCVKYGGDYYLQGLYIDLPLAFQAKGKTMYKGKSSASLSDDPKILKQRIAQLETQLEAESLKREAFEKLIEIAKRDLKIDLIKNFDTKQSPK